jgi:hypothetical protein
VLARPHRLDDADGIYSLVRDLVAVEEQAPVQVKGFAKPVRNYRVVVDRADRPAGLGKVIREEQDGLTILVDLQKLDAGPRRSKRWRTSSRVCGADLRFSQCAAALSRAACRS